MANDSNELEYARRLYDNVLDWYKNADTKAQVVLAINGGFITFVGSSVFKKAEEVRSVTDSFDYVTWIILALMISSLIGSIGAAIYCLWSRIYSKKKLHKIIKDALKKYSPTDQEPDRYPPSISCFFQFLERLEKEKLRETLQSVDSKFEIKALTNQIHILSRNVKKKHFAVNIGFMLVATTLIMFFAMSISYLSKVMG